MKRKNKFMRKKYSSETKISTPEIKRPLIKRVDETSQTNVALSYEKNVFMETKPSFSSEMEMDSFPKKIKKKKTNVWKSIFLIVLVCTLLFSFVFLSLWAYIFSDLKQRNSLSLQESVTQAAETNKGFFPFLPTPTESIQEVPYPDEQANFLIVGVDTREMENIYTNADAILVLSINQKTKKIKLTSFQRDLFIYVPWKESFHKLNSVMFGGPEAMMQVLNYNYKLNLSKYIVVNFEAVTQIVDLLGGVEVDVPEQKGLVEHWNLFIEDSNRLIEGTPSPLVTRTGLQTLNGRQALAYARIRLIDTDFVRMQRQQAVLKGLFSKLKKSNLFEMVKVVKTGMGYVTTNLSSMEIAGLATSVLPKLNENLETLSVPLPNYYRGITLNGIYYTAQAINAQMPLIHDFIYESRKYLGQEVPEFYLTQEEIDAGKSEPSEKDTSSPVSSEDD